MTCYQGAVGLEAMSRGCEEVHFVEYDPWIASAVLKRNVEDCQYTPNTTIRITVSLDAEIESDGF